MEPAHEPETCISRTILWNHGCAVLGNGEFTSLTRMETGAMISPNSEDMINHLHLLQITVPTPAMIDNRLVNAVRAFLRFRTGSRVQITQVRFFDGEQQFAHFITPLKANVVTTRSMKFRSPHPVSQGISLSLEVTFMSSEVSDAWVEIIGAGIEFVQAAPVPLPPRRAGGEELEEL